MVARCVFRISFWPKRTKKPSWWGVAPLVVESHEYFTPNIDIWALIDKQKNLWGDSPFKITLFCTDIDAEDGPRCIHMPPVQKLCTTFYGTSFIGFLSWIPKTQFISAKQKTPVLQFFHVVQFFNNTLLHLMQFLYFLLFYTTKVLLESLHGESFYHKSSLGN